MTPSLSPSLLAQLLQMQQMQGQQQAQMPGQPQGQPAPTGQPNLAAMISPPTPAPQLKPVPQLAEEDVNKDDSLEPLSSQLLRGMLSKQPTAQAPTMQDFEAEYKNSITPARSVLANMLGGMSSSLLGTKFQTVKEKKYEMWKQDRETQQKQQELQQQVAMHMASVAQEISKQRMEDRTKRQIELVKSTQDENQKAIELAKLGEQVRNNNLDVDKFLASEVARKDQLERSSDPYYNVAFNEATATLKKQGVDLSTNEGEIQRLKFAQRRMFEMQTLREKIDNTGKPGPPIHYYPPQQGPDGNLYGAMAVNGKIIGAVNLGRKLSAQQLDAVALLHDASTNMRTAATMAANNPASVGNIAQMMPPEIRNKFGLLPPAERTIRGLMDTATSTFMLAMTGKQANEKERAVFQNQMPKLYEKPETFYAGIMAFSTMLDVMAMKHQYNIEVDMSSTMNTYLKGLQLQIKAGIPPPKLTLPSAKQFFDQALKDQKKRLVKGETGTMEIEDDR